MKATNTSHLESVEEKNLERSLTQEVKQSLHPWRLDPHLNLPVHTFPCLKCQKFVAHTSGAADGRRDNEDWAKWLPPDEKSIDRIKKSSGEEEDDSECASSDSEQGQEDESDSESVLSDGAQDAERASLHSEQDEEAEYTPKDVAAHMRILLLLRSSRGRCNTNHLFTTDPALLGRRQEKLSDLLTDLAKLRDERDGALVEAYAISEKIESVRARCDEYDRELQRVDPNHPRKRPTTETTVVNDLMMDVDETPSQPPGPHSQPTEANDADIAEIVRRIIQTSVGHNTAPIHTTKSKKFPEPTQPAEELARWIQDNKCPNIKGVPACGPNWTPQLRDARGHQVMMTLARSTRHVRSPSKRARRRKRFLAILRVLIIPHNYSTIIQRISVPVANVQLSAVDFGPIADQLDEDTIALKLASSGLTVAIADDAWQFCVKVAEAEIKNHDSGHRGYRTETLVQLLQRARTVAEADGEPPGL
ncbi:hypothetical protein DFH07DRAFT_768256 [Mycena maculata]|uniref:Uncharacterized protein n=1 Tax=Mycena maculata TaxID=230809 RepID=A0AAD7NR79_9AGAR|nr:hypothetical protein DFH07DRAFT_768256 [Mycena maculata]